MTAPPGEQPRAAKPMTRDEMERLVFAAINVAGWTTRSMTDSIMRVIEQHILPAVRAEERAKVAAEIFADQRLGKAIAPYQRCIRVALGRDPDGWPGDEQEVNALIADRLTQGDADA